MTATRREHLVLTAVAVVATLLTSWHLTRNGWGNPYYAGIADTGGHHLGAALLASLEPSSVVSTDKPPVGLWPMMLAVHLLGTSSLAVLLPQLLETGLAVLLLGHTVRRVAGLQAGVLAAALLAATPVVVALARFDDPDTMLVLRTVCAAHAAVRLAEDPRSRRWMVALGLALGGAFLTKWLMGLVVGPALLWALWPVLAGRRLRAALTVGGVAAVSGLSWVAVLAVLGPHRRPTADGSSGSLVELILGSGAASRLAGAGGSDLSGHPGPLRLLLVPFADQVAWFLPAALLAAVLLLVRHGRRPAAGPGEVVLHGAVRLFSGWLVVASVLFSAMAGAMHPYYTSYLAPPAAALLALAGPLPRRQRAAVLAVAGLTGTVVLAATGRGVAWLALVPALATVVGVLALLRPRAVRPGRVVAGAAALALLGGPVVVDAVTTHVVVNGADPRAGWVQAGTTSRPPAALLAFLAAHRGRADWAAAAPQASPAAVLQLDGGVPVLPLGGFTGSAAMPSLAQLHAFAAQGRLRYVALVGRYLHDPTGTPASLDGHPVTAMVDWARASGCPLVVGGVTVVDLADHRCHAGPGSVGG